MILPHDHHTTDSDICQSPVSPRSHHPGFPDHCHAFNNLASEKATTFVIKYVNVIDFITDNNTQVYNHPVHWVTYYDSIKLTINSDIQKYASLRAPPSFS
jgi:hypothetical protein